MISLVYLLAIVASLLVTLALVFGPGIVKIARAVRRLDVWEKDTAVEATRDLLNGNKYKFRVKLSKIRDYRNNTTDFIQEEIKREGSDNE